MTANYKKMLVIFDPMFDVRLLFFSPRSTWAGPYIFDEDGSVIRHTILLSSVCAVSRGLRISTTFTLFYTSGITGIPPTMFPKRRATHLGVHRSQKKLCVFYAT